MANYMDVYYINLSWFIELDLQSSRQVKVTVGTINPHHDMQASITGHKAEVTSSAPVQPWGEGVLNS